MDAKLLVNQLRYKGCIFKIHKFYRIKFFDDSVTKWRPFFFDYLKIRISRNMKISFENLSKCFQESLNSAQPYSDQVN